MLIVSRAEYHVLSRIIRRQPHNYFCIQIGPSPVVDLSDSCCSCRYLQLPGYLIPDMWPAPPGWSGGSAPVVILDFEDNSCLTFHDGTEADMTVQAHVSSIQNEQSSADSLSGQGIFNSNIERDPMPYLTAHWFHACQHEVADKTRKHGWTDNMPFSVWPVHRTFARPLHIHTPLP